MGWIAVTNLSTSQVNIQIGFFVLLGLFLIRQGREDTGGFALMVATMLKLTPALLLVWLVIRGQKRRVTTGIEAMVGESGRVVQAIGTGSPGKVLCHGEIWNAVADLPLPADTSIVVLKVEGRLLTVASSIDTDLEQRS